MLWYAIELYDTARYDMMGAVLSCGGMEVMDGGDDAPWYVGSSGVDHRQIGGGEEGSMDRREDRWMKV